MTEQSNTEAVAALGRIEAHLTKGTPHLISFQDISVVARLARYRLTATPDAALPGQCPQCGRHFTGDDIHRLLKDLGATPDAALLALREGLTTIRAWAANCAIDWPQQRSTIEPGFDSVFREADRVLTDTDSAADAIRKQIEEPWREALLNVSWLENDGRCWCRNSPDDGPGRVKPHEERCVKVRALLNEASDEEAAS